MALLADVISVELFPSRPHPGGGAAVLVLLAFLGSYLFIRTSARMTRSVSWWPGGVETEGGVHLHHLVWGICLMLLCGFLAFAFPLETPLWHIVAIGFGIGMGFTLDEFALWVHLEDVYWSEEGRSSFDAVVFVFAFTMLVVLGTKPFGLDDPGSIWGTAATVIVVVLLTVICFVKGRLLLGVLGVFIAPIALVGALRLARPSSLWAKKRYDAGKLRRAMRRFGEDRPMERVGRRISDAVAGAPTAEDKDVNIITSSKEPPS